MNTINQYRYSFALKCLTGLLALTLLLSAVGAGVKMAGAKQANFGPGADRLEIEMAGSKWHNDLGLNGKYPWRVEVASGGKFPWRISPEDSTNAKKPWRVEIAKGQLPNPGEGDGRLGYEIAGNGWPKS